MKNRKVFTALSVLALLSASGMAAANTGNMTFSGSVGDSTCTVTGLSQAAAFTSINVSTMQEIATNNIVEQQPVRVDVTGCSGNRTNVNMSINFESPNNFAPTLANTEFRGGVIYILNKQKTGTPVSGDWIIKNSVLNIPITAGSGSLTFYPSLMRIYNTTGTGAGTGGETVVAGAISTTLQLAVTYP